MKKLIIYGIFLVSSTLFLASCQYKYTVEPIIPPPDPTDTIYFAADILPIWNNGNLCTSCHKTGATAPDLTAGNAYSALTSSGLIDLDAPESSIIYAYPLKASSTHSWKKYSDSQAALLLQWIQQGALNN